jgi:hypothetical protein
MIDGLSQAEPAGPFGWRRHPRVRLREWHSTPEFDFLDAEHDGYTSLPEPVIHRRRVILRQTGLLDPGRRPHRDGKTRRST